MLTALAIRDVVLIDRLDLEFDGGLTTLTGETGAGKSILLDALGLALGARAEAAAVRAGAAQAAVTATFEPPPRHPARALAAEHGLDAAEGLILRRVVGADGRSRAFVNDQPVSVALLRQLGQLLVEIHGQFESQGLLDPATHRAALDAFGGHDARAAGVAAAHAAWRAAVDAEAAARGEAEAAARDEEFLRHALGELDALNPAPGEETSLAEKRQLLQAGEKLAETLSGALAELSANKGVAGALRGAERALQRFAPQLGGRLDAALAALARAGAEAADAVAELESLGRSLDLDPQALERTEERLFALKALARKHRCAVDGLAPLRQLLAERLAAIDDGGGRLKRLAAVSQAAHAALVAEAGGLSEARAGSANRLDRAVAAELPPLKLEKAEFRTRLEPLGDAAPGPHGAERVVFEVATNPGSAPGPLAKIASGGELARFMLALRAVLAGAGDVATLVFDEVDSGVGGATAAAVGERLTRLAAGLQVLVVTHSPQVAARGRAHWRVLKRTAGGRATTLVERLDDAARREEIARMLAGATVTAAARAAADALLAGPAPAKLRKGARG